MPAMANPAHSTPNRIRCDVSLCINFSCQRHRMNDFSFVVLLFCGVSIHAYVLYSSRISVVTPALPDTTIALVVRVTAAPPRSNARGCSLPAARAVSGRRQRRSICRGGEMSAVLRILDLAFRPLGAAVLIVHVVRDGIGDHHIGGNVLALIRIRDGVD